MIGLKVFTSICFKIIECEFSSTFRFKFLTQLLKVTVGVRTQNNMLGHGLI